MKKAVPIKDYVAYKQINSSSSEFILNILNIDVLIYDKLQANQTF